MSGDARGASERWLAPLGAALLGMVVACGSPGRMGTGPTPGVVEPSGAGREAPPGAAQESDAVSQLVALGDAALERGELAEAQHRYQRALEQQPGAVRPRLGLARVALEREQLDEAQQLAEQVLAASPESSEGLFVMARVERAGGDAERARSLLWRVVRSEPLHLRAHAELEAVTGSAPRKLPATPQARIALAERHPYDPWATLQAARALIAEGEPVEARRLLASRAWLAGIDPEAGLAGLELLARLDPAWAARRVVPVHCYADETVRRDPAWAMRMRALFAHASRALEPVLDVVLLPVTTGAFRSAPAVAAQKTAWPGLEAIDAAFEATAGRPPERGIVALFTERRPPRISGRVQLGHAEYFGRRMTVRLEPGELRSRTLLHEVLHLYGAVHISDDVPSLMNPYGEQMQLDAANHRIAQLTRVRGFGPGGVERNVLEPIDPQELAQALVAALQLNLHFRRLGIRDAVEARKTSRVQAAREARHAVALDQQLGDTASFLARLDLHQGYEASAARYYEVAAALYGPGSARGRRARASADQLWRRFEAGVSQRTPE